MSQQINLFNPIFLKQKKVFSAVNMLDALALLLVGVALFYGYASIETLNLDRQSVETARQYDQARVLLAQTGARYAPKKVDTALEAEANALQAQFNARKAAFDNLGIGLLGNGASYAEYMRALARQVQPGLWLTSFKLGKGGAEMEIIGRALRPELVPSYIQRLDQERVMRGRSFDSLSMTQHTATLPTDAAKASRTAPSYTYTEFRLGSSHAQLPADAASTGPGKSAGAVLGDFLARPAQALGGATR